jgi:hypothetical protein
LARYGVESENLRSRSDDVDRAVVDNRRGLEILGIVAGPEDPSGRQFLHVCVVFV